VKRISLRLPSETVEDIDKIVERYSLETRKYAIKLLIGVGLKKIKEDRMISSSEINGQIETNT